ncbi:MAG: EamA family transporter [Clostridiaceae bacterium]|nr:MAG: EamA family transporter [Clostridiaceae bacterium]
MKTKVRNSCLLFLTACIWGSSFVAQSVGMDYIGPYTFNCLRFLIGGLVLLPVIFFSRHRKKDQKDRSKDRTLQKKEMLCGGIVCGVVLCIASTLQQIGIIYTTAGKAGFLTAMYIVLVPVLGLYLKRKAGLQLWISVGLALLGLYLLCMKGAFSLNGGDVLLILCAVGFSVHIMVVDYFSPKLDGMILSCIQFLVAGLISGIGMLLSEQFDWHMVLLAAKPILYSGVLSCGVGYTLQVIAQKGLNPTVASLLMSLESVVSVIAGFLVLHEVLSGRELLGCVFMFAAVILAQIPVKRLVLAD